MIITMLLLVCNISRNSNYCMVLPNSKSIPVFAVKLINFHEFLSEVSSIFSFPMFYILVI